VFYFYLNSAESYRYDPSPAPDGGRRSHQDCRAAGPGIVARTGTDVPGDNRPDSAFFLHLAIFSHSPVRNAPLSGPLSPDLSPVVPDGRPCCGFLFLDLPHAWTLDVT